MNDYPASGEAADAAATIENAVKPLGEAATAACGAICKESRHLADQAAEKVREHPVPALLGAAALGAAVCYLLMSGRHESALREAFMEPVADAGDNLGASLRSLYANLKFW